MSDGENSADDRTRAKITNILTIYPRLSMSMLQIGIGPNVSSRFWRPILEQMIEDGDVEEVRVRYTNHVGQYRVAAVIRLSEQYVKSMEEELEPQLDVQSNSFGHPADSDPEGLLSR